MNVNIQEKLISVIIPCYNVAPYIKRCLYSLMKQTYENLEIIIVDDASTDDTLLLLEQVEDSRVVILKHEKNLGQSAARNRGLQYAHGAYLGFVDGDDYISLDYYERLYENAVATEAEIVMAETECLHDGGEKVFQNKPMFAEPFLDKWALLHNGSPCDKLYKSDLIHRNCLSFCEGRIWEDNLFVLQAVYKSKGLSVIQGTYYYYVCNSASTMQSISLDQKRRDDSLFVAAEMMKFTVAECMGEDEKNTVGCFIVKNMMRVRPLSDMDFYRHLVAILGSPAVDFLLNEVRINVDQYNLGREKQRVKYKKRIFVLLVIIVCLSLFLLLEWLH